MKNNKKRNERAAKEEFHSFCFWFLRITFQWKIGQNQQMQRNTDTELNS